MNRLAIIAALAIFPSLAGAAPAVDVLSLVENHPSAKGKDRASCAQFVNFTTRLTVLSPAFKSSLINQSPTNQLLGRIDRLEQVRTHVEMCEGERAHEALMKRLEQLQEQQRRYAEAMKSYVDRANSEVYEAADRDLNKRLDEWMKNNVETPLNDNR